jgi:hypothetical protein
VKSLQVRKLSVSLVMEQSWAPESSNNIARPIQHLSLNAIRSNHGFSVRFLNPIGRSTRRRAWVPSHNFFWSTLKIRKTACRQLSHNLYVQIGGYTEFLTWFQTRLCLVNRCRSENWSGYPLTAPHRARVSKRVSYQLLFIRIKQNGHYYHG